jgi:tetratricopeptide (TPR) repeat protein
MAATIVDGKQSNQISHSSTIISPSEFKIIRASRSFKTRLVQNFHLVWLDGSIDEINNQDCIDTITYLREVVNTVNTFTDVDECVHFLKHINEEKTFIISSGAFVQTIVHTVHDMPQISAIYIFCDSKTHDKQWTKVKGVFTDIKLICAALKQAAQECDNNTISMSFIAPNCDTKNQNLERLDQSFMYTQVLKEILLTIDFKQQHIDDFIQYCREQFVDNIKQLENVDKLEREYHEHVPVWWYTHPCFLYSMLNRTLSTMEIDLILSMSFIIHDIHKHIAQLHLEQYAKCTHSNSFNVYRGQGLSQTDFDQLVKTNGGLLAFNNFLSTSMNRQVSLNYAREIIRHTDLVGILFVMKIDPSITTTPFANVRDVSFIQGEEEILFSMQSIFRIEQIKQIDENNCLWEVELTLTSDNDPQLHALTEYIREETFPHLKGWHRLAEFLIKFGQFDKAQHICEFMLNQMPNEREEANINHILGTVKRHQREYAEAIRFYEKSIEINQKILPSSHIDVAASYSDIGLVYDSMGEYAKSLLFHNQALEIQQKILPPNHPDLATSYNNIGLVYDKVGEYSKALSFHEKALEIRQKTLPPDHLDLANSYDNMGQIFYKTGEYLKALSCHEKALEIQQKTLSPNHPNLAISYNNIASVYEQIGEYSKALSYYDKDFEISREILPSNHSNLATSYDNMGKVLYKIGEYSKALSFHQKALEIYENNLVSNHLDFAICYNNIGVVYEKMGDYSDAITFHEKALKIYKKTLPPNHPNLATSYDNMGKVWNKIGIYSKALSSHEKALEIRQNTLPPNHPDFAISYANHGSLYFRMGDYSRALYNYEKDLEILKKTLPANHSDLADSYACHGSTYFAMGDYLKATLFYETALEIKEKLLCPNHRSLRNSYHIIGDIYDALGDYSKALSFYESALNIGQLSLPSNNPHLQVLKKNVANIKMKM